METSPERPSPAAPAWPLARLTSVVVGPNVPSVSRTKTSSTALSSSGERFLATDSKATYRPSAVMAAGPNESASPGAPPRPLARLIRSAPPVAVSRTKMSCVAFASSPRFVASGQEDHEAAIGRDRRDERALVAGRRAGRGGRAHQLRRGRPGVAQVDVRGVVGVLGREGAGRREGHELPVAGDRGVVGVSGGGGAGGAGGAAEEGDRPGEGVAQEDVPDGLVVLGHEVVARRAEGHEVAVRRDARQERVAVRAGAGGPRRPGDQVEVVAGRGHREGERAEHRQGQRGARNSWRNSRGDRASLCGGGPAGKPAGPPPYPIPTAWVCWSFLPSDFRAGATMTSHFWKLWIES